jgi:lipopolysaccharide heptosyltransferase II
VILTVPFLKNLKRIYKNAEITFMTGPGAVPLISECPFIDRIIIYDKSNKHSDFFQRIRFIFLLRQNNFDLAFILQRSFSSAFFAWSAQIPVRVGFNTEARGLLLTHKAFYDRNQYEPGAFLENLAVLGHGVNQFESPEIYAKPSNNPEVLQFIEGINQSRALGRPVIMFNSGPKKSPKYWSHHSFARLAMMLIKHVKAHIVLLWGPDEKKEALLIKESYEKNFITTPRRNSTEPKLKESDESNSPEYGPVPAPKTSLTDLAALISKADLLITVDSGPMHIGVALNVPTVTIFGPTNPVKWANPHKNRHKWIKADIPCWPCDYNRCKKDWHCMKLAAPEKVYEKALLLLKKTELYEPVSPLLSGPERKKISQGKTLIPGCYLKHEQPGFYVPSYSVSSIKHRKRFEKKKNILVVETSSVGEVVLITPAVSALRAAFANARITALVIPSTRDVIEGNPCIDEIICYDKAGIHKGLLRAILFGKSLKKKKFDLILLFHRSFRSAVISYFTGAPDRVGVSFEARRFLVNNLVPNKGNLYQHEIDRNIDVIRAVGIAPAGSALYFNVPEEAIVSAQEWLKKSGVRKKDKICAFYPGAGWESKRWPLENFVALGKMLLKELFDIIFIFWGPNEEGPADILVNTIGHRALKAPRTNLKELAAFMLCSNIIVANDTGPMHIAAALEIPQIVIMGPTSPQRWGPVTWPSRVITADVDCGPCNQRFCPDMKCLKKISPEICFKEVQNLVKNFENK